MHGRQQPAASRGPRATRAATASHHRLRATRAAAALVLLAAIAAPAGAVEEGEVAPQFSAPRLVGEGALSLGAYRGKVVYVDFWASWCAPCLVSLPALEELRKEFPADRFQILAVNLDREPARARSFLRKHKIGYPSATDPEGRIPERFGLETMPTSYLIDAQGVVRHVHNGFRKGDVDDLRTRIRSLLSEVKAARR
jgi:thiol-disulfide isomerase/thioredoxin